MSVLIPKALRHAILHDTLSQPNKMHIIAGLRDRGCYAEYRFADGTLRSRMSVQLEPGGPWREVKSFEFDVRPKMEFMQQRKKSDE